MQNPLLLMTDTNNNAYEEVKTERDHEILFLLMYNSFLFIYCTSNYIAVFYRVFVVRY